MLVVRLIWHILIYVTAGFVLSSGAVSLARLFRARHRIPSTPLDMERAQEGVWPPPPDYRQ